MFYKYLIQSTYDRQSYTFSPAVNNVQIAWVPGAGSTRAASISSACCSCGDCGGTRMQKIDDPGSSRMEPSRNYGRCGSITTWYLTVFLVRSRSYSVIIGGSDTINGVSGRYRYILPYLRVFLVGSRSYSVIIEGSDTINGVSGRFTQ